MEDRFERDLALLGEQWNELSYTCSKTWVEGRAAALEGAERVLRLAEGRFEDEIRWADVTRVACLGKIDRVEEWQWEDMLLRRFREVGMGVDVVSE